MSQLRTTLNRDLAKGWVDFMLAQRFQEDMPLQMGVLPVNNLAKLDPTFAKYLAVPEAPASVDLDAIADHREAWIEAWTAAVLR